MYILNPSIRVKPSIIAILVTIDDSKKEKPSDFLNPMKYVHFF